MGVSQLFIDNGYRVAMLARRVDRLEAFVAEQKEGRDRVMSLACDVTDRQQVNTAVDDVLSCWGQVDIMVANAGIGISCPGTEWDTEIVEKVFQVNVFGAMYCFEAVIPHFLERKSGQLVSISSLAAYRGLPCAGPYSGSKSALSAMTESLRLDLKPSGITVS